MPSTVIDATFMYSFSAGVVGPSFPPDPPVLPDPPDPPVLPDPPVPFGISNLSPFTLKIEPVTFTFVKVTSLTFTPCAR